MISVKDALAQILATASDKPAVEWVALQDAFGRTLAANLPALRTQPPFAVSAMDGFAVRAADVGVVPAHLSVLGQSAAGTAFAGQVAEGQAVRIFTGARVPDGADAILIQENATYDATSLVAHESVAQGRHIRPAGLDFAAGEIGLRAGTRLNPAELALAAAMNHPRVPVARKPLVAILATGDELVAPGEEPGPDQIVASNSFAIAAIVKAAGGRPLDLGIARDDLSVLGEAISRAADASADVLVTLGGASVGDHDLVQNALVRAGMDLTFWRIAMRPGKPMMHGRIGPMRVLGLAGNPVSSIVGGTLFLRPLIRALCGDPRADADPSESAMLATDLPANDGREDYLRGTLAFPSDGTVPHASANRAQDSSMLRTLAGSGCLIVRPAYAPAAAAGTPCRVIRLDRFPF